MARIRSTHPGQWTDERFVTCSPLARLLALGLRNEADDNGIFEWKPLTIKMRIFPADNCDVAELLEELISTDQVMRFSAGGKEYGIIRNFTKYQRPKKPTFSHPIPAEPLPNGYELHKSNSGKENGSDEQGSPPVLHQSGNPPAEEGGRRNEGGKERPADEPPAPAKGANPVLLKTFLAECKDLGVKPIPEDDPIHTYADDAGIPHHFLFLCWREFVIKHREKQKKQKDWRATFRNCVRDNWYRLWWLDDSNGEYKLTTAGKQAQNVAEAAERENAA